MLFSEVPVQYDGYVPIGVTFRFRQANIYIYIYIGRIFKHAYIYIYILLSKTLKCQELR